MIRLLIQVVAATDLIDGMYDKRRKHGQVLPHMPGRPLEAHEPEGPRMKATDWNQPFKNARTALT